MGYRNCFTGTSHDQQTAKERGVTEDRFHFHAERTIFIAVMVYLLAFGVRVFG